MTVLERTPPLPRDFGLYLCGLSGTALADALLFIALPFAVLGVGGSKADLAAMVLCGSLPRFAALFLGVWVDHLPARALLGASGLVRAVLTLGVALAVGSRGASPALLAAFAFLNGLLVTLTLATGNVLVPRFLPPERLAWGNSVVVGVTQGLPLVGFGLAGLGVKLVGVSTTLLACVPLYLLLCGAVTLLRPLEPAREGLPRPAFWADLREGWRVRRSSPLLVYTLLLGFLLNLILNVVNVRAPLFAQSSESGAGAFALFEGLFAGGALAGIFGVGLLVRRLTLERQVTLALGLFTAGVLTLAVPQWWVWWVGAALFGLGVGLLEVASLTLMQRLVPDGLRGRMSGLSISTGALGLSLGATLAGLDLGSSVLMGTLALLLAGVGVGWVRLIRKLRR